MACIYNNYVYHDEYGDIDLSKSYLEEIVNGSSLLRDLKTTKRNADGSVYLYDVGSYNNPMYFPYMTNFEVGLIWSEIKSVHMICPLVTNMNRAFFDIPGLTSINFYENKEKNKLNALTNVKDAFAMFAKNRNLVNPSFVHNMTSLTRGTHMWGCHLSIDPIKTEGDIVMNNMGSLVDGIAMFQNRLVKYDNIEVMVDGIQDLKANGFNLTDGKLRKEYTGMINIFFDTASTNYTLAKAKALIDKLVNKGWEVANNIGYNGQGKADTAKNTYYCRKVTLNTSYAGHNTSYEGGPAFNDNMASILEVVTGVAGKKTDIERKQAGINFGNGSGSFKNYGGGYYNQEGVWIDEKYPDGTNILIGAWTTFTGTSIKDVAKQFATIHNLKVH